MSTDQGNYEVVGDDGDNGDDYDNDEPEQLAEDIDVSDPPNFGEYTTVEDKPANLDIDPMVVEYLTSTLDNNADTTNDDVTLPEGSKFVYVSPGFTKVSVNMTGFSPPVTARSILSSCFKYINEKNYINKKMKVDVVIYPVKIPDNSAYYFYLKALCDYVKNGYVVKSGDNIVGLPIMKAGRNNLVICGCCGIQITDMELTRHVNDKLISFDRFVQKKWSLCPWCNVEFENDEEALVHWFDENHTIVACRNIIGEQDAAVNDARLHKGLPLPYTPFIQAALTCFMQTAPLASMILCQRVTKIDLANTNELSSCLSVEIAHMSMSEYWLPDCSICNERYYHHNVVHYSSIGAYDKNSIYATRACGHVVPEITKAFIGSIGLSLFNDMKDKMDGKKRRYGCSTFKTSAKKDYYDDEGPMKRRFSTLFESYKATNTTTSKNYSESVLQSSYYSQMNHQAVMFAYNRKLHDKYSGGIHIEVDDFQYDDSGSVEIDQICSNMEIIKIFRQHTVKARKSSCKVKSVQYIKVPVSSHLYAMGRNRNDYLKGRNGYVEYDMVKQQEYRVYPIAV